DAANLPIRIEHAPEVVLMDDSPLESVLSKPRSSIHVGLDLVKRGDASAFVSAGNSGAVMTASMMILGNLNYVDRPAIASLVPTSEGFSLLIDAGANTDVKPINLVQFAVMGSVYWRYVRNVSRPRVGILSNGEESSKGNENTRAAAAMLEQMPTYVHYIGYVEGRDINRAKADVVVTDGFTGNVALKTMEGFSSFLLGSLREVFGGNWRTRLAYLLVRRNLTAMRERLDPSEYGGAPLLGVSGVSIIAHGSSNPKAIRNAIRAAANEQVVHHVNAEILEILAKIQPVGPVKPAAGKGIRALFGKMRGRLHRREKEGEAAAKQDDSRPVASGTGPLREAPLEHGADHHIDPKIERANYESTHSRARGSGSLKNEPKTETAEIAATPVSTNGTAPGADKSHKSGELHPQDESDADARPPDRPKSDS
ncbi:MAG TPA: phosphate acyltransferase PlsX, partial [Candidatus Binatus sp.]|nr:phosphate acyltransferase PlsX [Candidatus Binatus sp.]